MAALSKRTANILIVTNLRQESMVLQLTSDVRLHTGAKYYREDYRNQHVEYNPENGDYGYVAANGGEAGLIPGSGFWNPVTGSDSRLTVWSNDVADWPAEVRIPYGRFEIAESCLQPTTTSVCST